MLYGEIPEVWKETLVTAIPKTTGAQLISQYRPISITPCPVKVMKKVIRQKLLAWLERLRVIPSEQRGFMSGA